MDVYGVGTALVTGSGAPTAGLVYKLVARAADGDDSPDGGPDDSLVPVAKKSSEKATRGGRKRAFRRIGADGVAQEEVIGTGTRPTPEDGRDLLVQYVAKGSVVARPSLDEIRARHEASRAELPPWSTQLSRGEPAIPTVYES